MYNESRMTSLRVLSLNVWGLHYLAKRIRERLGYIAEELKAYDIVALQEVWSKQDYAFLVERLEKALPHSHYFHSAIIGSGLCVFSRLPIISAFTHAFSVNGSLSEFADGEIFAGKGIMGCRIETGEGPIVVYNVHCNPRYRDSQLFEVMQFIQETRGNDVVLCMGDFNTKPTHLAYSIMTKCLRLKDTFEDDPVDTCDLKSNMFTLDRMTPKRIDFVFYSNEDSGSCSIEVMGKKLSLTGNVPGKDFPYSDHEGVEATFLLNRREKHQEVTQRGFDDDAIQVLQQITQNISARKAQFQTTTPRVLSTWAFLLVISLVGVFIFSNQWLFNSLARYNLHWLTTLVTALLGFGSGVVVFISFSWVNIMLALEANLAEIRTLLRYNSLQQGVNGDASCSKFE